MDVTLIRRRQRLQRKSGGLPALRVAIIGFAVCLSSAIGVVALAAGAVVGMYSFYVQDLPSAEEIGQKSTEVFKTTRVYDRTGKTVLYEIIPPEGGRRTYVPLSRIPEDLRNATIAMEAKTFYTNPGGINVEGLLRAVR